MSNIKMRPFDMANYLGTEEEIVEYLRQALEDNDPAELAAALGDIARARHDSARSRHRTFSGKPLQKPVWRTGAQFRDAVQGDSGHGLQAHHRSCRIAAASSLTLGPPAYCTNTASAGLCNRGGICSAGIARAKSQPW